jgi:hypothetical protein
LKDESELVALVAEKFKLNGWVVIVSRPSQNRIYFIESSGRRKAPDFIALKQGRLFVAEAKCRSADLFSAGRGRLSDVSSLRELALESVRIPFLGRVARRLASLQIRHDGIESMEIGLIAASSLSRMHADASDDLMIIIADAGAEVGASAQFNW